MKLYCFYVYNKNMKKEEYDWLIKSGATRKDIYPIYAITANKKFKNDFIRTRDMNQFVLITKKGDKKDCIQYMNGHRSMVLEEYEYSYYPNIKQNDDHSITVTVLSTFMEKNTVDNCCDESLMGLGDLPFTESKKINFKNPFVLKNRFLDALRDLEYDDFYKLFLGMEDNSIAQEYNLRDIIPENEDFPEIPDVIIDEFRVFIRSFGKYFK